MTIEAAQPEKTCLVKASAAAANGSIVFAYLVCLCSLSGCGSLPGHLAWSHSRVTE